MSLGARAVPDIAASCSVITHFERQARRTPAAPAVLCEGRSLSYGALADEVDRLAYHLRHRHGIRPGSIAGLLVGRSERMLISILAVLEAGGAYVPINPDYPAARVASILRDASPALLLTERRYAPLAAGFDGALLSWDDGPPWAHAPRGRLPDEPGSGDLAYVMYTSGSTGDPKGVMVEHGNLSNFIEWCADEYRASRFDIVYASTPYGFDLSNIEHFFPLMLGKPIRILAASQAIALHVRRDRNVLVNTVPSLVQQLLRAGAALDHVSVLNLGGEAVPQSLARALRAYPRMELRNMYGPTETVSTAINYRMDGADTDEILIGKPIANTSVFIVDDDLQPLPDGAKGEICIGGSGVARGYSRRPELTRERFVAFQGMRVYRTGDIGTILPDGNLRYLGRNDNQVKLRGFRIELDEIAAHLSAHPAVRDAVIGVRKTTAGDRLVGYVAAANDHPGVATLTAFLKERLPAYMIPDELELVDALPLAPTGKIDRHALFG